MMMKKTTSALAVAALLGTGAASAATFQVDENTSFSLDVGVYYVYTTETDSQGVETTSWDDNDSTLSFSGESTQNGVTTFANIQIDGFGHATGQNFSNGDMFVDQTQLGISGDFGTFSAGSDLDNYDVDGLKDIDSWTGVYGLGGRGSTTVRYDSPTSNGLDVSAAASIDNDEDDGSKGTELGLSANYDLGVAQLVASYVDRGNRNSPDDEAFYGAGISFNLGGVATSVSYESDTLDSQEADMFSVAGTYGYGAGDLYGVMQNLSFDSTTAASNAISVGQTDDSFTQYVIGITYNVTPNLSVWAEADRLGYADDEGDSTGVGINAYF